MANQSYVRVLMVVAFLVGIIGLLNFINIYTVIMSKRSREFGVKKCSVQAGQTFSCKYMPRTSY